MSSCRVRGRRRGLLRAFTAFGVKERGRADHHDRDREVALRLADPDLGEVEADRGRVPDPFGGLGWLVEHAAERAGVRRCNASAHSRRSACAAWRVQASWSATLRGVAELRGDVGDADVCAVGVAVGGGEGGGEAERFGLCERPVEHRAGDRLQQPFAHLAAAHRVSGFSRVCPPGVNVRTWPPSA